MDGRMSALDFSHVWSCIKIHTNSKEQCVGHCPLSDEKTKTWGPEWGPEWGPGSQRHPEHRGSSGLSWPRAAAPGLSGDWSESQALLLALTLETGRGEPVRSPRPPASSLWPSRTTRESQAGGGTPGLPSPLGRGVGACSPGARPSLCSLISVTCLHNSLAV